MNNQENIALANQAKEWIRDGGIEEIREAKRQCEEFIRERDRACDRDKRI